MKRIVWVLALLAVAGVGGLTWWVVRNGWQPTPPPSPPDPRLTFNTPFLNVRPEVTYVGDKVCASCHQEIAETYRLHPMGQSFAPTAQVMDRERFDEAANNPFTRFDTRYQVRRDGDRMMHHVQRKAEDGRTLFEIEAEAVYTMGSGTRGRSYLVEKDGHLFQSPISWFAQKKTWDISPGFGAEKLFDRPIVAHCLFCHANDATPVPGTVNRYRKPIFQQYAIGCERCHGPGELHVALRDKGDAPAGMDTTIVNPKHLEPTLREAVCQQCHLQGQLHVHRHGREPFDYRPGLPLHLFRTEFVRIPKLAEDQKTVGHVEQMQVSRCFQKSQGKLGCISCHDPHATPGEAKRVRFYRDRCLKCHGEQACTVAPAVRRQTNAEDSCIACHMPRGESSDIVHVAVTDHGIPRQPSKEPPRTGPPPALEPGEIPIVAFHHELFDPFDPEVDRDLGVALAQLPRGLPATARFLAPLAEPRLEAAVKADPRDVPSREGLAYSLWGLGRSEEALASYEKLLKEFPRREGTLFDAILLANQMNRPEPALRFGRTLVEINPRYGAYHHQLARAHANASQWTEAVDSCRAALRLSPARTEARQLLIRCLLGKGDRAQAREELETLVALDPSRGGDLRRWYAELAR